MSEINNIHIDIDTTYLDQESDPEKAQYIFSYKVTIRNQGDQAARLVSRYWKIIGSDGEEHEIAGDGVIGLHPYLAPTEVFSYTSAAMLDTPVGIMQGHYKMIDDHGKSFEVDIPPFTLAVPKTLH